MAPLGRTLSESGATLTLRVYFSVFFLFFSFSFLFRHFLFSVPITFNSVQSSGWLAGPPLLTTETPNDKDRKTKPGPIFSSSGYGAWKLFGIKTLWHQARIARLRVFDKKRDASKIEPIF